MISQEKCTQPTDSVNISSKFRRSSSPPAASVYDQSMIINIHEDLFLSLYGKSAAHGAFPPFFDLMAPKICYW
jgi:hypothetical protein